MMREIGTIDCKNKSLLEYTKFLWDNTMYTSHVDDNFVHLKCIKAPASNTLPLSSLDKFIELIKVISATCEEDSWNVDEHGEPILESSSTFSFRKPKLSSCFALTIHLWIKSEKHCRKLHTIKLRTKAAQNCNDMQIFIQKALNAELQKQNYIRPHKLLMVLNPIAGNKKAKSLHDDLISLLLQKAGIEETVFMTQYQGHATKYLESTDLSSYDGVVAVGGDGTFSDVVNGVLLAEQKKHGVSVNGEGFLERPIHFAKPSIRIGCIPSGSNNLINFTSQGAIDAETATLQIICGENHPLDVSSIHDDKGNFLKFSALLSSYAFPSDFLRTLGSLRYLGPARNYAALMRSFLRLRSYPCEITYFSRSGNQILDLSSETSQCRYPCEQCDIEMNEINRSSTVVPSTKSKEKVSIQNLSDKNTSSRRSFSQDQGHSTKVFRGNVLSINVLNVSCSCRMHPRGLSLSAHLSDGRCDVTVIDETSKQNFFNVLRGSMSAAENYLELPIVKAYRVDGMHFRVPSDGSNFRQHQENGNTDDVPFTSQSNSQKQKVSHSNQSCWVVDGEKTFDNVDITMWMHRGLINIFSRGFEKDGNEETSV